MRENNEIKWYKVTNPDDQIVRIALVERRAS
jgi:hypothetical protein